MCRPISASVEQPSQTGYLHWHPHDKGRREGATAPWQMTTVQFGVHFWGKSHFFPKSGHRTAPTSRPVVETSAFEQSAPLDSPSRTFALFIHLSFENERRTRSLWGLYTRRKRKGSIGAIPEWHPKIAAHYETNAIPLLHLDWRAPQRLRDRCFTIDSR